MPPPRVVCWFSCGDASAVATALAVKKYGPLDNEIVVARILIDSEHEDNDRFAEQCSSWIGHHILCLRSPDYNTPWEVWEERRYIAGIEGAPCTGALKKAVRYAFQLPDDIHVFGYTIEEKKRADQFLKTNHELTVELPLIEARLSKPDCHAVIRAAGIELPMMYRLGFDNNNCIGCPKGGAGYWNMIRKHFPEVFDRMVELSRRLGVRLIRQDGQRIFLDELRPDTGRQKDGPTVECSPFCDTAVETLELETA